MRNYHHRNTISKLYNSKRASTLELIIILIIVFALFAWAWNYSEKTKSHGSSFHFSTHRTSRTSHTHGKKHFQPSKTRVHHTPTQTKPPKTSNVNSSTECPIENSIIKATMATKNLVFGGIPKRLKPEKNFEVLKNIGYEVGYSEKRDDPIWVGYRVDRMKHPFHLKRPHGFKADFRTISRIKSKYYSKSGYDRGHMAPNAAIMTRYGKDAQLQTFKMSNITPQRPKLNRRVWKRLEMLEMTYANKYGSIWVITGPIFGSLIEKLKQKVEIPDKFFKILIDEDGNHIRTMQFIIPQNVTGREHLVKFLTSIDEIEKETNLDFFSPLSDKYENILERKIPTKLWAK